MWVFGTTELKIHKHEKIYTFFRHIKFVYKFRIVNRFESYVSRNIRINGNVYI